MSNQIEVVVFLGPPGSGKGTLSQVCIKKLGWQQLSTGNLCRKNIEEGTSIGKKIDFAIKSGKLIEDSLISDMVGNWLDQIDWSMPVILDGYPRTVSQAQHFHSLLQTRLAESKLHIVRLCISDEQIVRRLSNRYICKNNECQAVYSLLNERLKPKVSMQCDLCSTALNKRKDDEAEVIWERLQTYHVHESQLVSFFEKTGYEITPIDVDCSIDAVFDQLFQKVKGQV